MITKNDVRLSLSGVLGAVALSGTKEPQMTNTDRLAQFIEQMDMLAADFYKYQEGDPKVPFVIVRDATAIALSEYADVRAALASLAPAAVEGDDISWRVKWLRQARINNADETDNKWLLELADKVAALTAQCEADAKRLDWIENWIFQAHWGANVSEPCTTWSIQTAWRHKTRLMYGPNDFRTAIDSAIAAGSGEGV